MWAEIAVVEMAGNGGVSSRGNPDRAGGPVEREVEGGRVGEVERRRRCHLLLDCCGEREWQIES
jgi:hypothetical protein